MELGKKIKKLRLNKKFSMRELAEKLDVSQAHISKMENDENLPSIPLLEKMAKVFHVPITYFFDDIEEVRNYEAEDIKIAIDKRIKSDISEKEVEKALEFVKDLKNGKFDIDKLNNIKF